MLRIHRGIGEIVPVEVQRPKLRLARSPLKVDIGVVTAGSYTPYKAMNAVFSFSCCISRSEDKDR